MTRIWRILATGFSFTVFMVGGLFLAAVPFQLIRIFPCRLATRERWILGLIRVSFGWFMGLMSFVGAMKSPRWAGRDRIRTDEARLYVINHPTLIDVVAVMSVVPHVNCIVKQALWDHFFLGGIVRAAGFIPNSSGPELLAHCEESFAAGKSLIVFPEGTRSPANGLRKFTRGWAQVALRLNIPIYPIVIRCDPPTLMKHQPWHDVPARRFQLDIEFEPRLPLPDELEKIKDRPARVRHLTRYLEEHYRNRLDLKPEPTEAPAVSPDTA
jgi:1-acyl-sn-glycerol-3-phosphate acyltransferase